LVLLHAGGCSRNPATGQLVFNTVGEGQEIEFGNQVAQELEEAVEEYEHGKLGDYVSRVGHKVASASERPDLPWQFKVLDTWIPNAFAVAGGHIYVTRGLLAVLDSEAELAAVLAHEVGHVSALHSAQSLSRQRVRAAGSMFGVRGKLTRSLRERREFAHSREQEHEADELSLRYLEKAGYDPGAAATAIASLESYSEALEHRLEHERVLRTPEDEREDLARQSEADAAEEAAIPEWKKSHPDSNQRVLRLHEGAKGKKGKVNPEAFLAAIDGMVYGADPRDGFFLGDRLVHPNAGITMDIPPDWKAVSSGEVLFAIAKGETEDDHVLMIMYASEHETPRQAYDEFFEEIPFERGERWQRDLGDSSSVAVGIGGELWPDNLVGFAGFSKLQGKVFGVVAFSGQSRWKEKGAEAFESFSSLRILRERALLAVEPVRLRVQVLQHPTAAGRLSAASFGAIAAEETRALNPQGPDAKLPAGPAKVVVGRWPDLPEQTPREN
jgi:predicted Zn-dependent protease